MRPASWKESIRQAKFDYCPWEYFRCATQADIDRQMSFQEALTTETGAEIGKNCFISPLAAIVPQDHGVLCMGDDSFIAAHAYVTGFVRLGRSNCVNPYVTLRGIIRAGDQVSIGAGSQLVGFGFKVGDNFADRTYHNYDDSIEIGDRVAIGSKVMIVANVHLEDDSGVAAGAVVNADVPRGHVARAPKTQIIRYFKEENMSVASNDRVDSNNGDSLL